MIRNTGPGKRLLAAGIVLILGMTGCGTDNELSLTGTEETGIEVMATVDFTEEAATGENAPDVTDGDAAAGDAEQTTAHGRPDEGKGNLRHRPEGWQWRNGRSDPPGG